MTRRFFFFIVNALIYLRHPFLALRYRRRTGRFANVANPSDYRELIFWRKIFDRNPLFGVLCDKLACKDYIRSKTPDLPVAKTLWTGKRFDREAYRLFTEDTVLKANHGSNLNLAFDGRVRDFDEVRRLTDKWMRKDHHRNNFQHAYGLFDKTLFLEESLRRPGREFVELHVRVSVGKAILLSAATAQKTEDESFSYFELDGARRDDLGAHLESDPLPPDFTLPDTFRDAIRFAEKLGEDIDYARYDFYCVGDDLYGGEITLYPAAGLATGASGATDAILSAHWDLRASYFFRTTGNALIEAYKRLLRDELDKRAAAHRPSAPAGRP